MRSRIGVSVLAALLAAVPAFAATISGVISDPSGAGVPAARVVVRDMATGREVTVHSGADGRYQIDVPSSGTYLVIASKTGFSEAARTIVIDKAEDRLTLAIRLEVGTLHTEVNVTTARGERETLRVPLHVETMMGDAVRQQNPLSVGDALTSAVNVTPVGNGPFGVRPRLRGLDSTRLLVLVDGERLNTARQATDRTGAEVGLISSDALHRLEIVNGAGTLMYGSDALAGTINIITNEPGLSAARQWIYGLNGFYSANEDGLRGTVTLGVTQPRFAIRFQGGQEQFDNYRSGHFDVEDTRPLFADGTLHRADTIDDNFGFNFKAFPEPFNAPYVRTDVVVPNSQADGNFLNGSALIAVHHQGTLKLRYQRRRMHEVGFADFATPYFFNATSLPHSNLDRVSARYERHALAPWLANFSVTAYYQRTERLLRNLLPVQFPAPTPVTLFPIAVMRLDILSDTEQRVWTPGVELLATIVPASRHLLTAGMTIYQDRSRDRRTTSTTTSMVGQVVMGARGPAPVVLPAPVPLGPPVAAAPVRVPNASFRDLAFFLQDEWKLSSRVTLMAGLRADAFAVTTEATPGYDVSAVVAGAEPPIDPATLPDPAGAQYDRSAVTGDVGLVVNAGGRISPFVRVGRSYRHPNLEEMLFAGPATIGSIAPNVLVEPEVGVNVDAGANFRAGIVTAGVYGFVNRYRDFIAQDQIVAVTPMGPLAQAINYADVKISGVELSADAPVRLGRGVLSLSGAAAFTRGTIVGGDSPIDGVSLDGTPADNITPLKLVAAARFTDAAGRWWLEYGVRAQREVTRVATSLLESPFLIAQDLFSLDGFVVQRLGGGMQLSRGANAMRLTFAVENLTDRFYREQFQFAPARGRSITIGMHLGAF